MRAIHGIYIILFLLVSIPGFSQRPPANIPIPSDPANQQDTSQTKRTTFFTVFHGNPGKAALYSLVLPGAGQLYNKRWWKLPFVYALEGAAVYLIYTNSKNYNDFDFCWRSLVEDVSSPPVECQSLTTVSDAFTVRNSYRQNREASWLFLIGAHLFQTLEAFIDRHLIDFNVSEDLTRNSNFKAYQFESQLPILKIYIPLNKTKREPQKLFGL